MRSSIVCCLAAAFEFFASVAFAAAEPATTVTAVPLVLAQADHPTPQSPAQARPRSGASDRQPLQTPLLKQMLRDPDLQQQMEMIRDPQVQRLMQNPQLQRQMQQDQRLREMYQLQRRPLPGVGTDDDD